MKCQRCGGNLMPFILEVYKTCFRLEDGSYVKHAPPCISCNEEKFAECVNRDYGCDEFKIKAQERGWDKE